MAVDLAILVLRVLFGVAMAAHGTQKLFGWYGGYGLKGTGGFFEGLGFRPGTAFAAAAGLSEFGGGLLVACGFLTPFAAAAVLSAMVVAMVSVHLKNGFFAMTNGIELAFLYAVVALAVMFSGPGTLSVDALLGLEFVNDPRFVVGTLLMTIAGSMVTLALRKPAAKQSAAAR